VRRPVIFYILEGHEPVPLPGLDAVQKWGEWLVQSGEDDPRRVAFTDLGWGTVSTVFLGIDHGFGAGPPILFETMVFANPTKPGDMPDDREMNRYATWDEAEAGHAEMVAEARQRFWRKGISGK
jgi:hypothetical protein